MNKYQIKQWAGGIANYTTFALSEYTSTPLNPYTFALWYTGGSYVPGSGFHFLYKHNLRWHYIKFELKDPTNPGALKPDFWGFCGILSRMWRHTSGNSRKWHIRSIYL